MNKRIQKNLAFIKMKKGSKCEAIKKAKELKVHESLRRYSKGYYYIIYNN